MTPGKKIRIHAIEWDTDGETPNLPLELLIDPVEAGIESPSEELADYLSDNYGWCVKKLSFAEVTTQSLEIGQPKFLYLVDAEDPNGEDVNFAVVAADPKTARDLFIDCCADVYFDQDEIDDVPVRVQRIHPLGSDYDNSISAVVPWESVDETRFDPPRPEPDNENTHP